MDETKAGECLTITLDALTALALVGMIDLALKHPLNTGPTTVLVKAVREHLLGKIAAIGLLSESELRQAFDAEDVELSRHESQQRLRAEWEREDCAAGPPPDEKRRC
jgi:hypothetical protein